jgi:hypothetical protein
LPIEALQESLPLPAEYYRREAAKARRAAESVTTQAIKARLLDLARQLDERAAAADGAKRRPASARRPLRPPLGRSISNSRIP